MKSTQCKRLIPWLLFLALCLLLHGCGSGDDSSAASSESASVADSSTTEEDSSAAEEEEEESAPAGLQQLATGLFASQGDGYPAERAPQLEFSADGTGTFRVNTGMEIGTATGEVGFYGSTLVFTIRAHDIETEFWGSNLSQLTFEVQDENHLAYTGSTFGLTVRGDVFARQGTASGTLQATGQPASTEAVSSSSSTAALGGQEEEDTSSPDASSAASTAAPIKDDPGINVAVIDADDIPNNISVVTPGSRPPETIRRGEKFRLSGIQQQSLEADAVYWKTELSTDGHSAVLTALQKGNTYLTYATDEGENAGQRQTFSVLIEERIIPLWLVIAIAGAAAVVSGVVAIVVYRVLKYRKDNKEELAAKAAERKEQKAADAVQKKEAQAQKKEESAQARAEKRERQQEAKSAKKAATAEKKAEKAAKAMDKKAQKATKKAEEASQKAQQAAEKAAAAASAKKSGPDSDT